MDLCISPAPSGTHSLQIPITAFVNEKDICINGLFQEEIKKGETDLHDGIGPNSNYLKPTSAGI